MRCYKKHECRQAGRGCIRPTIRLKPTHLFSLSLSFSLSSLLELLPVVRTSSLFTAAGIFPVTRHLGGAGGAGFHFPSDSATGAPAAPRCAALCGVSCASRALRTDWGQVPSVSLAWLYTLYTPLGARGDYKRIKTLSPIS